MDAERIFRDVGLAEVLAPRETLRQQEASKMVHDKTGKIFQEAAAPLRTPLVLTWDAGSTSRKPTGRAGTLALLTAICETAPNPALGDATVTLTQKTEAGGEQTIATLTIPGGSQFGDTSPMVQVPAAAWLKATVTTANGVSGVSIGVRIEMR